MPLMSDFNLQSISTPQNVQQFPSLLGGGGSPWLDAGAGAGAGGGMNLDQLSAILQMLPNQKQKKQKPSPQQQIQEWLNLYNQYNMMNPTMNPPYLK
jgi:hypothetical protein